MTGRPYKEDPLAPEEREEFEEDLIRFSDRELDLLGDVGGLDVLYAGGSSLLWIEGLSQRVGEDGSVTALDTDGERVETTKEVLAVADLPSPVRLVVGNVFGLPFDTDTFDLVYSAGLFHELDVFERSAGDALRALASVVRPGGRVATGDIVDSVPATQLEDEALDAELACASGGAELFGVGPPNRLVDLLEQILSDVRWRVSPPVEVRHLGKVVLAEDEPAGLSRLPEEMSRRLRRRRDDLRKRIEREGYTRPATLYVEGTVRGG